MTRSNKKRISRGQKKTQSSRSSSVQSRTRTVSFGSRTPRSVSTTTVRVGPRPDTLAAAAELRRREEQSRRDKALHKREMRSHTATSRPAKMLTHHKVPFGHPDYNVVFANGLQHGPVPRPAFTPGKPGFSYLPSKGSVSYTITVPPQSTAAIFASPQCGSPFMVMTYAAGDYNKPLLVLQGTNTAISMDQMGLAFTEQARGSTMFTYAQSVQYLRWTGGEDPRTMVSGNRGSEYLIDNPAEPPDLANVNDSSRMVLSQFMGGRVHVSVSSSFNTLGQLACLDSKSFATSYGVKLPFTTAYSVDAGTVYHCYNGNVVTPSTENSLVEPSRDDFVRLYPSNLIIAPTGSAGALATGPPVSFEGLFSAARRISVMGGSSSSTGHCKMNLPPDGQGWFGWASLSAANPPLPTPGPFGPPPGGYDAAAWSATIGSAPAFNPIFYASLGQPVWLVRNDGSSSNGPLQCTINAEYFYNTQVPTNGPTSVLNRTAVVATPHAPETATINSVATLAHDPREAEKSHVIESHSASVQTRQVPKHPAVCVQPVAPSVSSLVPAAAHDPVSTLEKLSGFGGSHSSPSLFDKVGKVVGDLASDPLEAITGALSFL